eukprot:764062-Hanusia_phi.AAC.1
MSPRAQARPFSANPGFYDLDTSARLTVSQDWTPRTVCEFCVVVKVVLAREEVSFRLSHDQLPRRAKTPSNLFGPISVHDESLSKGRRVGRRFIEPRVMTQSKISRMVESMQCLGQDVKGDVQKDDVGEWAWLNIHSAPVANMMSPAPKSQREGVSRSSSINVRQLSGSSRSNFPRAWSADRTPSNKQSLQHVLRCFLTVANRRTDPSKRSWSAQNESSELERTEEQEQEQEQEQGAGAGAEAGAGAWAWAAQQQEETKGGEL